MGAKLLCGGRQNRFIDLMVTQNGKDHGSHFPRHMTDDRHVFEPFCGFLLVICAEHGIALYSDLRRHPDAPAQIWRATFGHMRVHSLELAGLVDRRIDTNIGCVITGMLGIGASGLYAAASKIPNLLNLAYSIFQQAWQLSTFQEYRKSDIGKFFSMILIPLQAVLTVGASFIMLISQLLASFMLQKSFYSAWTLIPVVLLGFYFSCMNTFYGTVYTTLMKTKYLMTTTIVGSLVCVIATAGLIPVLGLYGAGAASILCNAVIYVMRMINSRRLVSIDVNYCILVISIVLLGVQMMITAMAVPYYWVYGVLIFLVLTGIHGMRCVPLLQLVVGKKNK